MSVIEIGSDGRALQKSFAHEIQLPYNDGAGTYEFCMNSLGSCLSFWGMFPCCFCCSNPFRIVEQGSVGLISRYGRYYKSVDPGLWKINVVTEEIKNVDIKIQIEDIPSQVIMTKDNVNVLIDSVIFWEIVDPYTATFLVSNVRAALVERTQTTLRHIMGTKTLQESLEHREEIAHEIQAIIDEPARSWGVKIESMLIKDLQFSKELQETLSAAAKQKRIGESKIILAKAEVESAKLMREAADILNAPAAMQIRYLETLSAMSRNSGNKTVFMPMTQSGGVGIPIAKAAVFDQMSSV
ncbi:hypothetical protein BCR33DRAFT_835673 [Rhizoclosmatium globosum]|uniref:Band 7 domain-containing protein n=1 Tax=Rhizoclosmatium globosum TaxID=329046 RepID=A0A1Y2BP63_9FUNG|nr:hypothetical protein HDU79_008875 [Rhizoclosmatium sp. JEL0117]ORY36531.1 hypothetical protein BCR33DRAFT_835673 [Rhizoclosmatium globosum]|eukprot:ORY36531.1 hypothetical protein BCR33DRAFT_835673 [Rhizoclosmatium globosum]